MDFRIERRPHGDLTGAWLQFGPAIHIDGAAYRAANRCFDDKAGLVTQFPAIACPLCVRYCGQTRRCRNKSETFKK
jgi:hypothetical protein